MINEPLDEEKLSKILQLSGKRPSPPPEMAASIKEELREVWREEVESRPQQTPWYTRSLAIAATIALAVTVAYFQDTNESTEVNSLVFNQIVNQVEVYRDNQWQPVQPDGVNLGDRLRTREASFASITLSNGFNIRIDEKTTVTFQSQQNLQLTDGRVFADSYQLPGAEINIHTPFGSVADIGTQFSVDTSNDAWGVQVREGLVEVSEPELSSRVQAGERLEISTTTNTRDRLKVDPKSWQWAQNLRGNPYDIEGKSLAEYVHWFERETGESVVFSSPEVEARAASTRLHGTIDELGSVDSLKIVITTTQFRLVDSPNGSVIHLGNL